MQTLGQSITPGQINQIAQQIGADEGQTRQAIETALPMLIGGLARNANASPEGAKSLHKALAKDHDGAMLDNLGGVFGQASGKGAAPAGGANALGGLLGMAGQLLGAAQGNGSARTTNGAGILGHILGNAQGPVAKGVSRATGLSPEQSGMLLQFVAPLVMGAVGKTMNKNQLDAGGVAGMLQDEKKQIQQKSGGNLLESFLDADGDGQIIDNVAQLGGQLVSSGILQSFLK